MSSQDDPNTAETSEIKLEVLPDKAKPLLQHPLDSSGCLKRASFSWLSPLLRIGAKRQIQLDDVWDVPQSYRAAAIVAVVAPAWTQELARARAKGQKPSIMRALWPLIRADFAKWIGFTCIFLTMMTASPLFMGRFLERLSEIEGEPISALPWAVAFAGTFFVISHLIPQIRFHTSKMGTLMRVAVQELVFRASMEMTLEIKQVNTASVVNLMSVDAERFFAVTQSMMVLSSVPMIFFQSAVLVNYLGWLSLTGVLVMASSIPIQAKVGKRLGRFRGVMSQHMEERLSATKNFLTGIRIVKASGWVDTAHKLIAQHRRREVEALRQVLLARAVNLAVAFGVAPVAAIVTFSLYAATGGEMSPQRVFPALSVLRTLQMPLMMLPMFVSSIFEFKVARQRVESFLMLMVSDGFHHALTDESDKGTAGGEVRIEAATFAWNAKAKSQVSELLSKGKGKGKGKGKATADSSKESKEDAPGAQEQARVTELKDINLTIKSGELVVVLGPTGSGKTSLLMAMLGEMACKSGKVSVDGRVALAGQEPWIRSANVQENVLFRQPFDFDRYDDAIKASVLKPDMHALPNGDKTEIGERGINLSGGQKARVALARALYRKSECDIYILDDVLSAVDAHVGQAIVEEALLGALATKTRILVLNTFLPSVLPYADRVVVMSNGCVAAQGTVQECLEASPWLGSIYQEQSGVAMAQARLSRKSAVAAAAVNTKTNVGLPSIEDDKQAIDAPSELYKEEERETGVLQLSVYKRFFGELSPQHPWVGLAVFLGLLLIIVLAEAFRISHDIVVMKWVQNPSQGNEFWILVLGSCVIGVLVFGFSRAIIFMTVCSKISQRTHDRMLYSVFCGSVPLYFDVTPLGRILNRFSKDLDSLDMQLPMFMFEFLQAFTFILGVLSVCTYTSPVTLFILIPMLYLFYRVRVYYSCTSRELKRLESVSRSPVFNLFGETVNGLPHLRAFKMMGQQGEAFDGCCDSNFKVFFHLYSLTSWLIYRLDLMGTLMILSIGLSSLWVPRTKETSAMLGLGLTTAVGLMGRLHMTVQHSIETENHMTSVERLQHFAAIPKEASMAVSTELVTENWPAGGKVVFENVMMRYRPHLPLVLNKLSFEVSAGERTGIVGRTGCGKSSLMLAMLRIVEAEGGSVSIDGVDLSKVPLQQLRGKAISLIPQDPYLFAGSVRDNLDPFKVHSDEALMAALKRTYMDDVVESMGGLGSSLVEGGENVSAGQRQLICIARTMLCNSRVVLMDEATASIDMATDALIQKSMREAFKGSTVLTIAHRLDTVMDSDRIIVLDSGRVVEQGAPEELLKLEGPFASLAKSLGRDGASDAGSNDDSTAASVTSL